MATLVLGTLGSLIGGPLGGAIGGLIGRQIDGAVIGSGSREGPRLKDLAITTSSYGVPIAKHYGKMRAAGTIIWATDLQENRDSSGGGKGKPNTTTYSYSSSFAVAISSRPIRGIGKIWADGNLLRGAGGDLKASGSLRIYDGYGDQAQDPLLVSALGAGCPAFRHCAYAVFEDLQLEDFGNRIPALTFEIIADDGALSLKDIVDPLVPGARTDLQLDQVAGVSYEGGSLLGTLGVIDYLYPSISDSSGENFTLSAAERRGVAPIQLPPAAAGLEDGDFGSADGTNRRRILGQSQTPSAIRYYDTGRDYQIGVQRPEGRANFSGNDVLEFAGALGADAAKSLVNRAATRAKWTPARLRWRIAELDTSLGPGSIVQAPGLEGSWLVMGWEWRERGIELEMTRIPPDQSQLVAPVSWDPGQAGLPADLLPSQTVLKAFELPWNGSGSPDEPTVYVAHAGNNEVWRGASLYADDAGRLIAIGASGRSQSTIGHLITDLAASPALILDEFATIEVGTVHNGMAFESASKASLAQGANKLLLGTEIVQFVEAEQVSQTNWRLSGLLRGRAGTEHAAAIGHAAGTQFVVLNTILTSISPDQLPAGQDIAIAAIGRGDEAAVLSVIGNRGITSKPLVPVHPRKAFLQSGNLMLGWTRRSRGSWEWRDNVDVPLNEETELYKVGVGPADNPAAFWMVVRPEIELPTSALNGLSGSAVWVRQIGRSGQSDPLLLSAIP